MAYLVLGHEIRIINNDHIALVEDLPIGIYKYFFNPKEGSWLEPYKYNTSHSKIYGDAAKIANHITKRYELNETKDNFGVLLSGGKGLGKSLTVRLIVEKLKANCPIIIIDMFSPDLANFLSNIKNAIIIMDEFDKFMKGTPARITDEGEEIPSEMTKQEALLSVLDGVGNKLNNLYLLTCNSTNNIDTNLISRPGRIKYHYKFTSISDTAIRSYCKDNLDDKSQVEPVVKALSKFLYVSFDIVRAVVEELNLFDVSVENALTYLNVAKTKKDLIIKIYYEIPISTEDNEETVVKDRYTTRTYYDVDLNTAIAFSINENTYYIDLDELAFNQGTIEVPYKNIISENQNNPDIKVQSVKISLVGSESILGKSSYYSSF